MSKKIKLVALDMDGTVLNSNGEISTENAEAIKKVQKKGVTVVFSTGRTLLTCKTFAEALNLSSYLITVNGSEIWDSEGNLLERNFIETMSMDWMWQLSRKHQIPFWAVGDDRIWDNEMPDDLEAVQWLKGRFEFGDNPLRDQVMKEIEKRGEFEVTNSSPSNLEVNALGVNKAAAIQKVCSYMDLSMDEVMTMGDSLNDLAMIKQAGLGVAMGNAQRTVKEAANWVTATNDHHGVAVALEKWVL